ncbi:MAG: esterase [Myxococcales bacterium]|nr:esterase [Myxococcales bacterium]
MTSFSRNVPHSETIGELEVVRIDGRSDGPAILIFHGYGADCHDLVPLRGLLPNDHRVNWFFPNGPLHVPITPFYSGRAWFPIDVAAIERAMRTGRPREISMGEPQGLAASRKAAFDMISRIGVPWDRLILGGFSQGAMLATDLALHAPQNPAGLVILSGTLLNEETWKRLAPSRAGLRFFQSHGDHDLLLPLFAAKTLNELLAKAGLIGEWIEFSGGHEIPSRVNHALSTFLASCVAKLPSAQ